ncbi:MAG: site-specific integrase [Candidatus Latescibacteria bacterium]|nr:site-specific integrase [Candidatus Latescibacterota bacterium]
MGVFKRKGNWWIDTYVNGRRIRRKVCPDKRTAELALKNIEVRAAKEDWLEYEEIKPLKFEAFSRDYLKYVETNLSPGRYRVAESAVRVNLVPFFGRYNLKEITPQVVEEFKTEQGRKKLKASSINSLLAVLRAMLNLAVKWKHLRVSPFKQIKTLKVDTTEPPHLSVEEADRILEAYREDRDLYTFTAIGLSTGMRVGEIVNLTWSDVDLSRRVVKVRPKTEAEGVRTWRVKTGDLRDIPINDFLADVLARHPRHISCPYVLYRQDGTPHTEQGIRDRMEKADAEGVHVNPHLLRHTFGTTLAAAGVDLDTIRHLMGHTDIKMTMRYLHAAPDRLKGAVENLPFGHYLVTRADEKNQAGR